VAQWSEVLLAAEGWSLNRCSSVCHVQCCLAGVIMGRFKFQSLEPLGGHFAVSNWIISCCFSFAADASYI